MSKQVPEELYEAIVRATEEDRKYKRVGSAEEPIVWASGNSLERLKPGVYALHVGKKVFSLEKIPAGMVYIRRVS